MRVTFNIFRGVGIAIIFSIIFLFILSIVLTYTDVTEEIVEPIIMIVSAISILIGSSIGISKIKKRGIINGALIGTIYFFTMFILSSLISRNFSFSKEMLIITFLGIIFGIIGGIIGVNATNHRLKS